MQRIKWEVDSDSEEEGVTVRGRINKEDVSGGVIIDSMMNLPLLYWATLETGDTRFGDMAVRHANTILRYGLREDGSANHIIVLNPKTGEFIDNTRGQGFASGSGAKIGINRQPLFYLFPRDSLLRYNVCRIITVS